MPSRSIKKKLTYDVVRLSDLKLQGEGGGGDLLEEEGVLLLQLRSLARQQPPAPTHVASLVALVADQVDFEEQVLVFFPAPQRADDVQLVFQLDVYRQLRRFEPGVLFEMIFFWRFKFDLIKVGVC